MSDRRFQTSSRVSVEDLLRVKRAERPPPEFWAKFERELRQKQLAALVERRSWWHGPVAAFNRFGWLRLPVGAMTVLAVTVVSIRHYSSTDRIRDDSYDVVVGNKLALPPKTSAITAESKPTENVRAVAPSPPVMFREETAPKSREAKRVVSEVPPPPSDAGLVQRVAELDDSAGSPVFESLSGSLATRFRSPGVVDPVLLEATFHPVGFEERSISMLRSHSAAEVLPTAVAATEQRRSRLLADVGFAGTYAAEPSAPEHAKRSVLRHLAEDGWDRSISRLEAEADRFSIRF
jgi:hypothetical protein